MTLDLEPTVSTIVETMLPRGSGFTRALLVQVHVEALDRNGESLSVSQETVHLVFARPNQYTKVWVAVTTSRMLPTSAAFTLRCNHDSAWRSDGLRDIRRVVLGVAQKPRVHETYESLDLRYVDVAFEDDRLVSLMPNAA